MAAATQTEKTATVLTAPSGAQGRRLDAHRWHFNHGPIDLIVAAEGDDADVAIERLWQRFTTILIELVNELPLLRSPVQNAASVQGRVARRMLEACWPHRGSFITPMAAVAGAVADELIEILAAHDGLRRAYVNNGGDIALHLCAGEQYRVGLFADLARFGPEQTAVLAGDFEIASAMPIRGIATSGWRGRSFSLGIADSVTVLARNAAVADAAATMVANSVNVDDPAILRKPANTLKDDTDLGERLVTVAVEPLRESQVRRALDHGARCAQAMVGSGLIEGAALWLQGHVRTVGCQPGVQNESEDQKSARAGR